jgi:hypothetical protein
MSSLENPVTDTPANNPTPTHPERNESMKTETTETTALEAATTEESPETSPIETSAGLEANEVTADQDSVLDQEEEEGEEVEEELPEARRFKDLSATDSAHPVSKLKLIAIGILVALGLLTAGAVGNAVSTFKSLQLGGSNSGCQEDHKKYDFRKPDWYQGSDMEYIKENNLRPIATCDNYAFQR